ncbi:hypothetical protein BJ875DRAFT_385178 [Amylocarpus encephaloides]|uniref:Uncharacterized protein n=1 Tax=Amylocarpus encephaloides TaxID=45428 RepID=A0A9P7YB42_9HELO|nr:hypothetical protein BJ875DRAFT_385178 [Amylocarpus encephaloides]
MPKGFPLPLVTITNKTLIPSSPLTAVFTGATAGIGSFSLLALAKAHGTSGHPLRVYLVGRNSKTATAIVDECKKVCPSGDFRFVRCGDLALLRDVDGACREVVELERGGRVDLLCMSHSSFSFTGSDDEKTETTEGLDSFLSLLYYSRVRFTTQLLPLLQKSTFPRSATVISVFGPNRRTEFFPDDLSLRDPGHYSFMNAGSVAATLKTFVFEELAKKSAGQVRFCPYFPGLVTETEGFKDEDLPLWFKVLWPVVRPVAKLLVGVGKLECGERVMFHLSGRFPARGLDRVDPELEVAVGSDGLVGGGAYRCDWNGELVSTTKEFETLREEGWAEKSLDHTMRVFEIIESGKLYTE